MLYNKVKLTEEDIEKIRVWNKIDPVACPHLRCDTCMSVCNVDTSAGKCPCNVIGVKKVRAIVKDILTKVGL